MVSAGVGKTKRWFAGGQTSATGTKGASAGVASSALSAHTWQPARPQGMAWSHGVSQQG